MKRIGIEEMIGKTITRIAKTYWETEMIIEMGDEYCVFAGSDMGEIYETTDTTPEDFQQDER